PNPLADRSRRWTALGRCGVHGRGNARHRGPGGPRRRQVHSLLSRTLSARLEKAVVIAPSAAPALADGHVWDVLVAGAGPAGALAARQAALAGKRVLFVDSRSFPRAKVCGACLNGQALSVLNSVGLGTLPAALGGVSLGDFDVRSAGRGVHIAL